MTASIIFIVCLVLLVPLLLLNKVKMERDRRVAIEAQVARDVKDAGYRKAAADKYLRERGQRP